MKQWELAQKLCATSIKDLDVCQRKVHLMIYFFDKNKLKTESVRAGATYEMTLSVWHF